MIDKITNFFIGTAQAQEATRSNISWADFNFLKITNKAGNFNVTFSKLIGLTLTIAAITAFIYLLISGFTYITSNGDDAKATTGRKGIVNAIIGIIIILAAYTIIRWAANLGDSLV